MNTGDFKQQPYTLDIKYDETLKLWWEEYGNQYFSPNDTTKGIKDDFLNMSITQDAGITEPDKELSWEQILARFDKKPLEGWVPHTRLFDVYSFAIISNWDYRSILETMNNLKTLCLK